MKSEMLEEIANELAWEVGILRCIHCSIDYMDNSIVEDAIYGVALSLERLENEILEKSISYEEKNVSITD